MESMEPFLPSDFFKSERIDGSSGDDPPEKIGRYRVTQKLGEGGMGVVYAAQDERLNRSVAVKRIRLATEDTQARERLWREARTAASVSHPNICHIYEFGDDAGEPYLVMELLEGESMAARMAKGSLPLTLAAEIILSLLGAIGALHARGLVHRDLKPSNVFLTPHGIKLLDFGLARVSHAAMGISDASEDEPSDQLTQSGVIVGTPRYMSPEQLDGEPFDHRSDLFAVGAILYELITGRPAFPGNTPVQIYHAVMFQQPPALGGSAAINALNPIVLKALCKNPEDRYATAEDFAQDLQSVLLTPGSDEEVSARPVSRLIVLPFRMLRPEPELEYLARSLSETISSTLSRLDSLQVRSSITAAKYSSEDPDLQRIADEAGVDSVLTGTLLSSGGQIRLSAQLLEAPAGTVLWSITAMAPADDLFSLEESLCNRVVETLPLQPAGQDQRGVRRDVPGNPMAYEFYLRGSQLSHNPVNWPVARDLLLQSVGADPYYAPAWARLARIHWLIGKYTFEDPETQMTLAQQALHRALQLNPGLPAAIGLRAHLDVYSGRCVQAMTDLIRRARQRTNDADVYSSLVLATRFCGLAEASIAAHKQARRLDPSIRTSIGYTYFFTANFELALDEGRSNLAGFAAEVYDAMGEREKMLEELAKIKPGTDEDSYLGAWNIVTRGALLGEREASLKALERIVVGFHDPEGTYLLARHFAHWGETDRALELLAKSVDEGYYCLQYTTRDSRFASLRGQPRLAEILRRADEGRREAMSVFIAERGDHLLGLSVR
jgi:non-specific serine/threonine protein kinase